MSDQAHPLATALGIKMDHCLLAMWKKGKRVITQKWVRKASFTQKCLKMQKLQNWGEKNAEITKFFSKKMCKNDEFLPKNK